MKICRSTILAIILATVLAASLFFIGTRSVSKSIETGDYEAAEYKEYDPWCDINDDGVIDVTDFQLLKGRIPSAGTVITKAALTYDSGWIDITDKAGQYFNITHNLNTTDIMVDIQGKSIMDGGVHQQHLGLTGYTPGWSKTYGGPGSERAESMVYTDDSGFALAGATYSFGNGGDFWLVKTDPNGVLQWNKTYGGSSTEEAYSMVQTIDGGYALAGYTTSFGAEGQNFFLVKTDMNGILQWNNTYGGLDSEWAYTMIQTGDGGYALAGYTKSDGVETKDIWLVKTDANGVLQWSNTYGGTSDDVARSMVQTDDGGYVLAGQTYSFGAGSYDFYLVKTYANGVLQWNKTYGGTNSEWVYSVVQTGDGGYALAGYTHSFGAGHADFWLVKTDANGKMQWNKTYGGSSADAPCSVVQTADGGYALAGIKAYDGAETDDFWLVKTDTNGNVQWNQTYGGSKLDWANSVVQTGDGGYALAGYTYSFGVGSYDFWLVKTDVESGLAWTDSTPDTITLYRGVTDPWWNYVKVRIWEIKESP